MTIPEYNTARKDRDEDFFNTINVVKKPPLAIDSHMHTMSSHCTPLPLIWQKSWFVDGKSSKSLDRLSSSWAGRLAAGDLGVVGQKDTVEIGKFVVDANKKTFSGFKDPNIFCSPMITLPMDMEYAHFAGFTGHQIYFKVSHRYYNISAVPIVGPLLGEYYYPPAPDEIIGGNLLPTALQARFLEIRKEMEDDVGWLTDKKKDGSPAYFVLKSEQKEDSAAFSQEIIWLDHEEIDIYVTFDQQELKIRASATKLPFKLIPLYHYDPRRWNNKPPLYQNLIATASKQGAYVGIKVYPSLGYNPSDFNRIKSVSGESELQRFYKYCNDNKLPIISHCSPDGMPTHERKLYLQMDNPDHFIKKEGWFSKKHQLQNQPEHLRSLFQRYQADDDRYDHSWEEFYFSESYVAPKNWEPVVRTYPDLKLCLAHFGGDSKGYTAWSEDEADAANKKRDNTNWDIQIINMIKKYDNCYVDISFFFVKKYFDMFKTLMKQDEDDKIKKKILFGTDWYLIEMDKYSYEKYCKETKTILDEIDKSLWIRFSCLNPMVFFGFTQEAIAENLTKGLKHQLSVKRIKKYLKSNKSKIKKQITDNQVQFKQVLETAKKYQKFLDGDETNP